MEHTLTYLLLSRFDKFEINIYYVVLAIITFIIYNNFDKILFYFPKRKIDNRRFICSECFGMSNNFYFPKTVIAINKFMRDNNIKANYTVNSIKKYIIFFNLRLFEKTKIYLVLFEQYIIKIAMVMMK
jgi:hypothetical protein